mmetsp:Transcript_21641/g.53671  ORF Transcript_21641/g.53671 Transcript_21641/m.53671 type:complete len:133 (+) Transcript_21641:251-649(+)
MFRTIVAIAAIAYYLATDVESSHAHNNNFELDAEEYFFRGRNLKAGKGSKTSKASSEPSSEPSELPSSACVDYSEFCSLGAKTGCPKNPEWMLPYCAVSCNSCDSFSCEPPECVDTQSRCPFIKDFFGENVL